MCSSCAAIGVVYREGSVCPIPWLGDQRRNSYIYNIKQKKMEFGSQTRLRMGAAAKKHCQTWVWEHLRSPGWSVVPAVADANLFGPGLIDKLRDQEEIYTSEVAGLGWEAEAARAICCDAHATCAPRW